MNAKRSSPGSVPNAKIRRTVWTPRWTENRCGRGQRRVPTSTGLAGWIASKKIPTRRPPDRRLVRRGRLRTAEKRRATENRSKALRLSTRRTYIILERIRYIG